MKHQAKKAFWMSGRERDLCEVVSEVPKAVKFQVAIVCAVEPLELIVKQQTFQDDF